MNIGTHHLTFLREQLARAEAEAEGWRELVAHAEAHAGGFPARQQGPATPPPFPAQPQQPFGTPPPLGRPPYPGALPNLAPPPGVDDPRAQWTPEQEQRFQAFEGHHEQVCRDEGGPRKADACVLDRAHVEAGTDHDDGNGHTWPIAKGGRS